jgi:hypothetical protein
MGRGAAGVPTGSVRNARRCLGAECRVRRRCRARRARCRANGRPARRSDGRQHGPGDDGPAQARRSHACCLDCEGIVSKRLGGV